MAGCSKSSVQFLISFRLILHAYEDSTIRVVVTYFPDMKIPSVLGQSRLHFVPRWLILNVIKMCSALNQSKLIFGLRGLILQ